VRRAPSGAWIAWFGIRGIGSLYYLFYAINHDLKALAEQLLLSITAAVVVTVVLHGSRLDGKL
jgi:NhaP-type Na+/H+ or K+/H+ antiporter